MSFFESVGIDVGVIGKGLNYKVSIASARISDLETAIVSLGNATPYSPVSLGNYLTFNGCGCSNDVNTVGKALDILAQARADTLQAVDNIEQILQANSIT